MTIEGPIHVTVIVPVYGAGPHLEVVIAALERQRPPVESIIISHSGACDPSPRFHEHPSVKILHSRRRLYAGAARNRGLALAGTELVAFIDEDVIVDGGWAVALQKAMASANADCIAGAIGYAASGGYWGMSLWFSEFGSVHPYLSPRPISSGASANLIVRRDALLSVGGFPEDWRTGEDALAQARMESKGYSLRFEPSVVGRHINVPGLLRMVRYSCTLGGSSAKLRRIYPGLKGGLAVRWPVISLGMWIARLCQVYKRVVTAENSPLVSLIWHTPGILLSLVAWNFGFTREAFSRGKARTDPPRADL